MDKWCYLQQDGDTLGGNNVYRITGIFPKYFKSSAGEHAVLHNGGKLTG